jgi:hypothetical protein
MTRRGHCAGREGIGLIEIWADSTLSFKSANAAPLVWSRDMALFIQVGPDKTTTPAQCLRYLLGLKVGSDTIGYSLFEDGTARFGRLN